MAAILAAKLSDFRNGPCVVQIDGVDIGLFQVGEEIFALEDSCPHAGLPLHKGEQQKYQVTCGAHGWCFDLRTGSRPEDSDGFPIPCFYTEIRGEEVWIDIERRTNLPVRR
jgi:nitrite reductase/ring-hydroxylating ferredoxin subunit